MKIRILLLATMMALSQAATIHDTLPYDTQKGVYDMNNDNFDEIMDSFHYMFVVFYDPGCFHSQRFLPEMEAIAPLFEQQFEKHGVAFGKVSTEGIGGPDLMADFHITGHPSAFFFVDGLVNKVYPGNARERSAMRNFILFELYPASQPIENMDDFEFAKENENNFPLWFGPLDDQWYLDAWEEFADTWSNLHAYHTDNRTLALELGVTEWPTVVLYKSYALDEPAVHYNYTDPFESEYVTKFWNKPQLMRYWFLNNAMPTIQRFSTVVPQRAFAGGRLMVILFVDSYDGPNAEASTKAYAEFHSARDAINELDWPLRPLKENEMPAEGEEDQTRRKNLPTLTYIGMRDRMEREAEVVESAFKGMKFGVDPPELWINEPYNMGWKEYKMRGRITKDRILKWLTKFLKFDGSVKRKIWGEEVPKRQRRPVHKLVASTHDDFVYDTTKDVMVLYWRSDHDQYHLEQQELIQEIMQDVAIGLKDEPNLVLAEVDIAKNDVVEVFTFQPPQMLFWRSNYKDQYKFDIWRNKNAVDYLKFFREMCTDVVTVDWDTLIPPEEPVEGEDTTETETKETATDETTGDDTTAEEGTDAVEDTGSNNETGAETSDVGGGDAETETKETATDETTGDGTTAEEGTDAVEDTGSNNETGAETADVGGGDAETETKETATDETTGDDTTAEEGTDAVEDTSTDNGTGAETADVGGGDAETETTGDGAQEAGHDDDDEDEEDSDDDDDDDDDEDDDHKEGL